MITIDSYNIGFYKSKYSGQMSIELLEGDIINSLAANSGWAYNDYDVERILDCIPKEKIENYMIRNSPAIKAMNNLKEEVLK